MKNLLRLLGLCLAITVLSLLVLGCAQNEPTPEPPEPTPSPSEPTPMPTDLPVEIVIYTDLNCKNCARLHFEVERELVQRYVNTGKATMKIYLLAALGPESVLAAQATLCAAEQDRFWEYRDNILAAWREAGKSAYSEEQLRNAAKNLGLDEEAFGLCLRNPAILEKLQQNLQKSQADGINEVPIVLINGIKVVGIQPLETFIDIIEEQLAK